MLFRKLLNISLLVSILLLSLPSLSQVSTFTVSYEQGCSADGLTVDFTYTGTSGATSFSWDFGNGNTYSLENGAVASYTAVGVYTATLNCTYQGGGTASFSKNITIFQSPVASFTITTDSTGCVGLNVGFADNTLLGDGAISTYSWTFGDGSPPAANNPTSHTYTSAGVWDVKLIIMDVNGCGDAFEILDNVYTTTPAAMDFTASQTEFCTVPVNVTFTDNSVGSTPQLTSSWNFDDGSPDTLNNPITHTFSAFGFYNVVLTATDTILCANKDSVTIKIVNVNAVMGNDDADNIICRDGSVLFNPVGSTSANTFLWYFGDGDSATTSNPTHVFDTAGAYNITFIASSNGLCPDTATDVITVELVEAMFSVSDTLLCNRTQTVQYTDQSIGANSWEWHFGDSEYHIAFTDTNVSTVQNPVHTFNAFNDSLDTYYTDTLIITSALGCVDSLIVINSVEQHLIRPTAYSNFSDGCLPLAVQFTDGSTPPGRAVSWSWDMSIGNSIEQNPDTTYFIDGTYVIQFTVTDTLGCDTVAFSTIAVGFPQVPSFTSDTDTVCAYGLAQFLNTSTSGLIDGYAWSSVEDGFLFSSSLEDPFIQALDSTGYMAVEFTVLYNGCDSTILVDSAIFVTGAVGNNIDTVLICASDLTRTFTANFQDTTSYKWIFEDVATGQADTLYYNGPMSGDLGGTLINGGSSPTFTFPSPSNYRVTLLSYNGSMADSCEYISQYLVFIRDIVSSYVFTDNDVACIGEVINFDATGTIDASNNKTELRYTWDFGDTQTTPAFSGTFAGIGNISDTINPASITVTLFPGTAGTYELPSHSYTDTGSFVVELTIWDLNGCPSSYLDTVRIFRPIAGFTVSSDTGCVPMNIVVTDTTYSDTLLVDWVWKLDTLLFDSVQNSSVNISSRGQHTITLAVTDTLGCQNIDTMIIVAIQPDVNFIVTDTTICQGDSVFFTNTSATFNNNGINYPAVSYAWNFGDGGTSTLENPSYAYTTLGIDTGLFNITLTVVDTLGCDSSLTKPGFIDIQGIPIALFYTPDTSFCFPKEGVEYIDSSIVDEPAHWYWLIDGVVNNDTSSVFDSYTQTDTIDVQLIIETSYECRDTLLKSQYVWVKGVYFEWDFLPKNICKNDTVTFFIVDTNNVSTFRWGYGGNGPTELTVSPWDEAPSTHAYQTSGIKIPSVDAMSLDGCPYTGIDSSIFVNVYAVNAGFTINDTAGCPPFYTYFQNSSTGVTYPADTWSWVFEDGGTSNGNNPGHTFTTSGIHNVTMTIQHTALGCVDSWFGSVLVYPPAVAEISADTVICVGTVANLLASGAGTGSYLWKPVLYVSDSAIANPTANPDTTMVFRVTVTDDNGCVDTTSTNVKVIIIPDLTIVQDTTIHIGDTVILGAKIDPSNGYFGVWSEPTYISCSTCDTAIFRAFQTSDGKDYTYMFTVWDDQKLCPAIYDDITITVIDSFKVSLPNSLSPNGDGVNDRFTLRGWGIQEILEFKIYNRWGEQVFENVDGDVYNIDNSWDGSYKGEIQNMDTYVYVAQVLYYNKTTTEILKGYISLIR